MQIGDVCDLTIDGIGTLSNPIAAVPHGTQRSKASDATQAPVRRAG